MDINTRIDGNVAIIDLSGRLDLASANQLKDASRKYFQKDNCKLILNMDKVDFINSSGLGALVSILKEVRNHKGEMKISNLAEYVREIFDITQLSSIFDIYEDESHALRGI
jgi:anti-sigma B factor antagonist